MAYPAAADGTLFASPFAQPQVHVAASALVNAESQFMLPLHVKTGTIK